MTFVVIIGLSENSSKMFIFSLGINAFNFQNGFFKITKILISTYYLRKHSSLSSFRVTNQRNGYKKCHHVREIHTKYLSAEWVVLSYIFCIKHLNSHYIKTHRIVIPKLTFLKLGDMVGLDYFFKWLKFRMCHWTLTLLLKLNKVN